MNAQASAFDSRETHSGVPTTSVDATPESTLQWAASARTSPEQDALRQLEKALSDLQQNPGKDPGETLFKLPPGEAWQEAMVEALRTENLPQFKRDSVRAAAFEALSPHFSSERVALTFIEELEINRYQESCAKVVNLLNEKVTVSSLQVTKRLIGELCGDDRKEWRSLDIAPRFSFVLTKDLMQPVHKYVESEIRNVDKSDWNLRNPLQLLAVSQNEESLDLLQRVAQNRIKSDPHWGNRIGEYLGWTGLTAVGSFVAAFLAFSAFEPASEFVLFAGLAASQIRGIYKYFIHRDYVQSGQASQLAVKALRLVASNPSVQKTLIDIYKDSRTSGDTMEAALKSLEMMRGGDDATVLIGHLARGASGLKSVALKALRNFPMPEVRTAVRKFCEAGESHNDIPADLGPSVFADIVAGTPTDELLSHLSSPVNKIRIAVLKELSSHNDPAVLKAVRKTCDDTDPEVRKMAYQVLRGLKSRQLSGQ